MESKKLKVPSRGMAGRTVIVADYGVSNVGTFRAGIMGLVLAGAGSTVLAVPVASQAAFDALDSEADDMVCLLSPGDFRPVDFYYADFTPPTEDDVIELLRKGSAPPGGVLPDRALRP